MIGEIAKAAIELLKLAPRYLFTVAIVAALLLFIPETWLDRVGLVNFVQTRKPYIGGAFLASTVLFLVDRVIWGINWFRIRSLAHGLKDKAVQRLENLTEDEKQILRYYFARNTRANVLRIDDGVVQGLAALGIIYRSAQVGTLVYGFAFNISDFAWEYLGQRLHLLNGTTDVYRTDERKSLW